jgi:hypothetical protein
MSKQNNYIKFLKKIYLSINSLLEKNLNKLNFKKISNKAITNKVFLTFIILSIVFFSYILIPHTYNKDEIRKELEVQLLDKFSLNFIFSKNLNYKFFPRPHFTIENSSIIENQLKLSDIKKIKVFVSLNNLFSLKNVIVKDIVLENTNFHFNKQNYNFFLNLLDNDFSEGNLTIKDSNIFYRNNDQQVLFLNKIKKMKYYYDPKELRNIVSSTNEIFNIPYSFETYNNQIENKIISKINLNFLKFQIESEFDYSDNLSKGLLNFIYKKNKSKASYEWDKNSFKLNYFDKINDPNFFYEGNINFNPFFSTLRGNTNQLNLISFFNNKTFFSELFKTEILNNKNLNIDLKVDSNKVFKLHNIINLILNFKIQEGLIDFNNTEFSWNNYIDFMISDSLLYVSGNQLILDGKLVLNIKNLNEIYKFLQSSRNRRPQIKKIEFNFNYNFDEQSISFNTIKIDDKIDKKVNNNLKKMLFKNDRLQNKIYFKSKMKEALKAYAG